MNTAVISGKAFFNESDTSYATSEVQASGDRNLLQVEPGTYTVKKIDTSDEDMNAFLFRLGCYSGERITVISRRKNGCIVVIKDGRYNLDTLLASAIIV